MTATQKKLSLKKNMLWNATGSLCNLGCQWFMTVIIVRLSDNYADAGLFALAMSVYGIFLPIAQYRMYIIQISDTEGKHTPGEYLAFRIITCLIALVLCMGYAAITCEVGSLLPIFFYGLYKTAGQLIDVLHASDQVHDRMDYIGISLCLQGVLALLCFALLFGLTKNLSLTLASMALAVLLIGVFYDLPRTKSLAPLKVGITPEKVRFLLIHCLPVVIGGIAFSASPQLPRQLLFMIEGDTALGIYASVAAPITVIQMGASYIYYPFLTYLSKSYADHDRSAFLSMMAKTTVGIAGLGVIAAVLLELFAVPLLVLLYGASISSYGYLVLPLLVSAILTGYVWFLNDLLIALRNFKAVLVSSIAELITALSLSIPLIHAFSMNGATFATIAACIICTVVMALAFIRMIRANFRK